MFTLIRRIAAYDLAVQQAPTIGASLVIAELFYKFHSFTLEALGFLATWFVLDAAASVLRGAIRGPAATEPRAGCSS